MDNQLNFKGTVFNGPMDMASTKFVCVPSKPHYAAVDLCLKADGNKGCNIVVAEIDNNCLSFDEKKKLGYEIEKRWNASDRVSKLEHALTQILELAESDSTHFGSQRKDIAERAKETLNL